jgi:hypothetical protein
MGLQGLPGALAMNITMDGAQLPICDLHILRAICDVTGP